MHPAIASSLAVELDRLATLVRRSAAWPSPATGFAWWLAHRHGRTDLIARPDAGGALADAGRLDEAPVLAAHGYLLAGDDDPDHLTVEAWSDAARRLGGRDPLPGDRASFFFRPTELLGLALGAAAIAGQDPQPRRWLRQTLHAGRSRLGTDTWSITLNTVAATTLGDTGGAGRFSTLAEATTVDLAAAWVLGRLHPQAATGAGLDQDAEALETGLLYLLTTTATSTTDIAEATAVHTAATAAIGTGLTRPNLGLPAALTTITGTLRRFPAIVRDLNNRHAGRKPLVKITDEYDVQDLLRGVLRGLFDDVRDEEYTPQPWRRHQQDGPAAQTRTDRHRDQDDPPQPRPTRRRQGTRHRQGVLPLPPRLPHPHLLHLRPHPPADQPDRPRKRLDRPGRPDAHHRHRGPSPLTTGPVPRRATRRCRRSHPHLPPQPAARRHLHPHPGRSRRTDRGRRPPPRRGDVLTHEPVAVLATDGQSEMGRSLVSGLDRRSDLVQVAEVDVRIGQRPSERADTGQVACRVGADQPIPDDRSDTANCDAPPPVGRLHRADQPHSTTLRPPTTWTKTRSETPRLWFCPTADPSVSGRPKDRVRKAGSGGAKFAAHKGVVLPARRATTWC